MALNITEIQTLTPDQFLLKAHEVVGIPTIIACLVLFSLIFFMIGMILSNNKEKMFKIWIISLVFNITISVILIWISSLLQTIIKLFT